MITINNVAALNSNLYIAGYAGAAGAAGVIIVAPGVNVQVDGNINCTLAANYPVTVINSTGNLALHGVQPANLVVRGGNIDLIVNGSNEISLSLESGAQITLNSDDSSNIKINYKGRLYSIDESVYNIALNEITLDYLGILLESSNFKPPLYESADEFASGLLDIISASDLREIQAVDKNLIHSFIKSNIVCDGVDDVQPFMESVIQSVDAKIKRVDERFLKINGVVKSIEEIAPENAAESCVLMDVQANPLYDSNAVWSEIFAFLSSADTGIAAEFPAVVAMGEDEAKEESKEDGE